MHFQLTLGQISLSETTIRHQVSKWSVSAETFGDIQGVHIIADDMIIAASSEQEPDEILDKVMEEGEI